MLYNLTSASIFSDKLAFIVIKTVVELQGVADKIERKSVLNQSKISLNQCYVNDKTTNDSAVILRMVAENRGILGNL